MRRIEVPVPENFAPLPREELVKLVRELVRERRIMRAQIRSLMRELAETRAQKGHAPFSKGPKKGQRKKPGRKKGQGTFSNRLVERGVDDLDAPIRLHAFNGTRSLRSGAW